MTSTRRSLWNRSTLDRQDPERPQGCSGRRSGCHLHSVERPWAATIPAMSETCMEKRIGPRTEPCGTSNRMRCLTLHEDEDSIIWLLPERQRRLANCKCFIQSGNEDVMVHSVKRRIHVKKKKKGDVTNIQCQPDVRHNSQYSSFRGVVRSICWLSWGAVHCCWDGWGYGWELSRFSPLGDIWNLWKIKCNNFIN